MFRPYSAADQCCLILPRWPWIINAGTSWTVCLRQRLAHVLIIFKNWLTNSIEEAERTGKYLRYWPIDARFLYRQVRFTDFCIVDLGLDPNRARVKFHRFPEWKRGTMQQLQKGSHLLFPKQKRSPMKSKERYRRWNSGQQQIKLNLKYFIMIRTNHSTFRKKPAETNQIDSLGLMFL